MKDVLKKSRGMPRRRLQHIYDLARVKTACEGGGNPDKTFDPMSGDSEEMIKHTVRPLTPVSFLLYPSSFSLLSSPPLVSLMTCDIL